MVADLECGYRFVREIAAEYGGDLDKPVVNVGHSLGATMGLDGALNADLLGPGGTYDVCFSGADRPDAMVAIAGCHYEHEDRQFPFDATTLGSGDASIVLISGEDDEVCAPWQSADATDALRTAGFDVTLVEVPDASHLTLIGKDHVDGEFLTLPDEPAAALVAQAILKAIETAAAE